MLAGEDLRQKHEYYLGEVFALAGASRQHNEIGVNLITWLRTQLRRTQCRPYAGDMRLKVDATGLYTYPDVLVACEPIEVVPDEHLDTVLNPRLIVEILSESTEAYDRGAKFRQYATIPSLIEYVLVSQTSPVVERMVRQADGTWAWHISEGLAAECQLASLNRVLPLAEIYADVHLPPNVQASS